MADLTQKIQLVVEGFRKVKNIQREVQKTSDLVKELASDFRQVDRGIRDSQKTLNRVGRDRYKRDAKGRFVNDPDRNIRRDALSSEVNLIKERKVLLKTNSALTAKTTALNAAKAKEIDLDKARQKSVQTELRLQANKTFISRKLIEGRAAGLRPTGFGLSEEPDSARGKRRTELNQALDALEKGFNDLNVEGNENVATFRAFGSQISRTVEELNALNRAVAKGSIGLEKGRRLQERVAAVDPILRKTKSGAEIVGTGKATDFGQGAAAQRAREAASNVIAAAKSGDQNLYNAALSKATAAVSRLEREYKEAERVQKKASQQSKKAQRRLRNIRKIRQDRNDRMRESLMLGAGFPLLFGGGIGSVAGGVGGALAQRGGKGFGAQILFSAIGQQFDKLISSMVSSTARLGQALGSFTQDTSQIVTSLGLAGTAEGERIKMIETLQGKQAAFNAAMQQLVNAVGAKGASDLKMFGDNLRLVSSEFRIFFTQVQAGIANLINAADRFFKVSQGAQEARLKRFAETTKDPEIAALRKRRDSITRTQGGRGRKKADIQKQIEALAGPLLAKQDAEVAIDKALMGENELLAKKKEQFELDKKIVELKKTGMSEALATEVAGLQQVFEKGTENLEADKKKLQETIRSNNKLNISNDDNFVKLKEINKALEDRVKLLGKSEEELKKYLATQKQVKEESEFIKVKMEDIKETIASGMTSAVQGLIDGTKSLGESLASIAKSIASMYLKAAFMNMLPGLPAVTKAEGGYMANGIKPFAYGGMATRPTLGLVGEAGEDEYIIPASKMAASMQRYSAGARGEAVIPGTGSSYAGGGAGGSTTVNYSGPILNFNSEEFVPKSAIGEIINSAASRGAKAGEARTLSSLQNSRSRRATLGL